MTRAVLLPDEGAFEPWRDAARALAMAGVAQEDVVWGIETAADADLFASPGGLGDLVATKPAPHVPRAFVDLARWVCCHHDPARFALLYRLLLRLQDETGLLERLADPDVHRAEAMAKAARRERHKMTAFVRFREVALDADARQELAYVAWFEPEHPVVKLTAPFFVERFASMRWSILTPAISAHWDRETLSFGPGAQKSDAPSEDALEEHWRTYYAHIFNPARLKIGAMKREMPMRYWANLPEAALIAPLVREAAARERAMVEAAPAPAPARAAIIVKRHEDAMRESPVPPREGLAGLAAEAASCTRCPLWKPATQTVFGEGPRDAKLVFVGEQPGDVEDLEGKPFVGPSGRLFDRALGEIGLDRGEVYVTNAVKHFKFEPRGKRRLHKSPNVGEIKACRFWLEQELAILRPGLTIALGSSALRSLTGRSLSILRERGNLIETELAGRVFPTVHPSFLLRQVDQASKDREYEHFVRDLGAALKLSRVA